MGRVMTSEHSGPLISVLLPTHNRPETLRLAIDSLLTQTIPDIEILVVGDGCADPTRETMAAIQDGRVRWFDLPKAPGFGYANRNVALAEARGSFMAYMAHDDLAMPDHLERLLKPFDNPSVTLVYSRPFWVDDEGRILPVRFNLHDPAVRSDFLDGRRNLLPACCLMYRFDQPRKLLSWDETLLQCGDWDLWKRIILSSSQAKTDEALYYLPEPTTFHFKANWRAPGDEGIPDNHIWRDMDNHGRFPTALRVKNQQGHLQQQEFAQRLRQGPQAWPEELRRASTLALDSRAEWDALKLLEIKTKQKAGEARAKRLRSELDHIKVKTAPSPRHARNRGLRRWLNFWRLPNGD